MALVPNSYSKNPPGVCCLAFINQNSVRLIDFPPSLLESFENAIQTSWKKGLNRVEHDGNRNYYLVELHGSPWSTKSQRKVTGVVETSRLLLGLTRFMLNQGWVTGISMTGLRYHDMLYFSEAKDKTELHPALCCVAFSKTNKIRVIEGGSEVVEAVQSSIELHWGLKKQKSYEAFATREFILLGKPWNMRPDKQTVQANILLTQLMFALKNIGWVVYTNLELRQRFDPQIWARWILKKRDYAISE